MKINKEIFFDQFRPWFKKKSGKKVLSVSTANGVDFLLDQFQAMPEWKDVKHVAYALATIAHETAWTFLPIKEYRAKAGSKGRRNQDRYWLSGYYGRGYVQLTWDYNYKKAGQKLGINLLANPALALRNDIAFKILTYGMTEGWFTGKKLSTYINSREKNYKEARRIINGQDKAATIASYAEDFEKMLRASLIIEDELASRDSLINRTGSSQPVITPTEETEWEEGKRPEDSTSDNPVDGVSEGQAPAEDVESGEVKPGEAAPEQPAKAGEAVVGGRPDDPPIPVEKTEGESISGWKTWPTTVWGVISGAGLSVGGVVTKLSGIEITETTQIFIGIIMILGIIFAGAFGIFYLWTRSKGTSEQKAREHEIHMKELELASRPDRYNVKLVG